METRLLRVGEVSKVTTLSRAEIYRRIRAGTFPKQTRISWRFAVWKSSDIEKWIAETTNQSE